MEEKYKDLLKLFNEGKYPDFIEKVQSVQDVPPEDHQFLKGYLGAAYNNVENYNEAIKVLENLNEEEKESNPKTLYRLSFSYYFLYENDLDNDELLEKAAYYINQSFNLENPVDKDYRKELAALIFYQTVYITPNFIDALFEITKDDLKEHKEYYYYYAEAYFMLYVNSNKEMYYQRAISNYFEYLNRVPEDEFEINNRIEILTQIFNQNNNNIA